MFSRLHRLVRRIQRSALPEILACTLSAGMALIGLSFIALSHRYAAATWGPMWEFASHHAWGIVMIAVGLTSVFVVWAKREWAPAPLVLQTALWAIMATLIAAGFAQGGVPSAVVIYAIPAWLNLVLVLIYTDEARDDDDEPLPGGGA